MSLALKRSRAIGLVLSCAFHVGCGGGGGGEGEGAPKSGEAGTLREDSVVVWAGAQTDADAAAHCRAYPNECTEDHISIVDVARDGDNVYVLANIKVFPMLFVSEDSGATWTGHLLPPSYDVVEGIEDNTPGNYAVYPWEGRVYLLVAATSYVRRFGYWAIAEVDLDSNTYALRTDIFGGRVRFENGTGFEATSEPGSFDSASLEYGNVYWQRYDFTTDKLIGMAK